MDFEIELFWQKFDFCRSVENENLNWLLEENDNEGVTQEESNAYREDVDLVFRTLAHFLRRVPGYLDKHSLICKIRPALVDNACQTLPR